MINENVKKRIVEAMAEARKSYTSDSKHATSLGVATSVYSAVKNGNWEGQLSEAMWISLARRLDVKLRGEMVWRAAKTETFEYVTAQLTACQEGSLSGILCDLPNIGKTFAARHYARTHHRAVYIDCSQVKSKQMLVRQIAKCFGLSEKGRYVDVYSDLVFYIGTIDRPLVILDEAGDLKYDAFLELKALWNATEGCCGWYMMGADGLAEKIQRSIEYKKVGYTEILSRYGGKCNRVTPADGRERDNFLLTQAVAVASLNIPEGADAKTVAIKSGGALRRVYTEIEKIRRMK